MYYSRCINKFTVTERIITKLSFNLFSTRGFEVFDESAKTNFESSFILHFKQLFNLNIELHIQ